MTIFNPTPAYNKTNILQCLHENLDYEYVMADIIDNAVLYKELLYSDNLWFWRNFFTVDPRLLSSGASAKKLSKENILKLLEPIYDFSILDDEDKHNIFSLAADDLTGVSSKILTRYINKNNIHYSVWLGNYDVKDNFVLKTVMKKLTVNELKLINDIDDIFTIEDACKSVEDMICSFRLPDVHKQGLNKHMKESFISILELKNNISRMLYVMPSEFYSDLAFDRRFKGGLAEFLQENVQPMIEVLLLEADIAGLLLNRSVNDSFKV